MIRFALTALLAVVVAAPADAQNAADAYYDPQEMAAARAMLRHHHGETPAWFAMADRLEYQSGEGDPLFLWDAQGWYGGDVNKFWWKSEGETAFKGGLEEAEVQALWSRAIGRYFDFQGGVRRDVRDGPDRTYAVLGVQGLAPYFFDIDAAAFISGHGEATARIEVEYDLLLTQRLIFQPRTEINLSAQDVPELGLGSGLTSAEAGARLRYEIRRQFAPYIGVSWRRDAGRTADFTRAAGGAPGAVSLVAGVRLWF
ncbi:MAG: copper resistance protein B [Alphaproteobacteria bacterium]|nr:copper resistance protein B [Alphaproteobacteria bacterium]